MTVVLVTKHDAKLTRCCRDPASLLAVVFAMSCSFGEPGKKPSPAMMHNAYTRRHESAGRCRMPRAREPAIVMGRQINVDVAPVTVLEAKEASDWRSNDPEGATAAFRDRDGGKRHRIVAEPAQK